MDLLIGGTSVANSLRLQREAQQAVQEAAGLNSKREAPTCIDRMNRKEEKPYYHGGSYSLCGLARE